MKPRSVPVGLAAVALLTFGVKAPAITYTAIMNGENSTKFSFLNNNINPRSTVTSIQSPFAYPTTITGSTDTQTYPSGNSSATPPWWFYYSGNFIANDSTGVAIGRPASYGQTSFQKSSVIGIRPKAAYSGTVSGSSGTMYEAIYFSERVDWSGQREFGFSRQMSPGSGVDQISFYWSTNSNCSTYANVYNMGYPWCRTSRATGAQENPQSAPLVAEYLLPTQINGLTTGTTYYFKGYIFWATWDSTYKFRVEVWDSTNTIQITAFNVNTSSGGVNYGATTSGMSGYVTATTQRADPNSALTSHGAQLSVTSIDIITP